MIPIELQKLPQWVCAGPNKKPINPRNGKLASPTDYRTWGTYEQATQAREKFKLPHIGFVLSENDPYCIIDLDKPQTEEQAVRHKSILQHLDSYTEISQSGNGLHIIVKAKTPKGYNKDKVELYSNERYIIITGNILDQEKPINDRQDIIDNMVLQLEKLGRYDAKVEKICIDNVDIFEVAEVHESICSNAYVADEYELLCKGNWKGRLNYQSQSDADFNLACIIREHTDNEEVAKKLFTLTGMFREEKPKPYLDYTFNRAKNCIPEKVELVDASTLLNKQKEEIKAPAKAIQGKTYSFSEYPPGLIGELAEYMYSAAIRPVREMALAGALSLVAGIAGRSYTISNTGLNQYIVLLAGTGKGKESIANGIASLIKAVEKDMPSIREFEGPSSFSSGQALMKHIADQPCFFSLFSEFGLLMQGMSGANAADHKRMYRQALLQLYTKSGPNDIVNPSVYAKKEDSTELVRCPSITLLGESTPEAFYPALSEELIKEGLIPRFHVMEYRGIRPPRNKNAFHRPNKELIKKLQTLTIAACHTANNDSRCPVLISSGAEELLDRFDEYCDKQINNPDTNEVTKELWNRAHLKALRFSALVAVGNNVHKPVVSEQDALWSIKLVTNGALTVISRFEKGEVGEGESVHESKIREVIRGYFDMDKSQLVDSYAVKEAVIGKAVIPHSYFSRRLTPLACFRNDRRGAKSAIKAALIDAEQSGILQPLSKQDMQKQLGFSTGTYYAINEVT